MINTVEFPHHSVLSDFISASLYKVPNSKSSSQETLPFYPLSQAHYLETSSPHKMPDSQSAAVLYGDLLSAHLPFLLFEIICAGWVLEMIGVMKGQCCQIMLSKLGVESNIMCCMVIHLACVWIIVWGDGTEGAQEKWLKETDSLILLATLKDHTKCKLEWSDQRHQKKVQMH